MTIQFNKDGPVTEGNDQNQKSGPLPDHQADPPYLDRLRFYRDEVKHEFNLLAIRSTILVTCQSFLIVPFAILNTATQFRVVAFPAVLVALLGLYTSWVIQEPIRVAHRLINEWLLKQRRLLRTVKSDDYKTERDKSEGVDLDTLYDRQHVRSMAFSTQAPIAFQLFWTLSLIWVVLRSIFLFGEG